MVSEIVKVLLVSTVSIEQMIPESFMCCMSPLIRSPKISVTLAGVALSRAAWYHIHVTKNCFVTVWLLGTKRGFIIGTH